ncbi:MAG: amidase [Xanthobacteraceae bacterium]|nr:amidase [Xanthobacteraceae bacterium]
MRQAEVADQHRKEGKALGPLHGVPVGIKDIFDTGDMPTEFGSPLWAGRTPRSDAAAVAALRGAGAVIMGKTVTTEYAYFHPGKTRNPHDPMRTPGGSSSGSAAAVAAGMVPGAIGSQTNGSVIRPAAFCGVVGFKPTHGLIPRSGSLLLSRALDHVGVFARSVEDAALMAEVMAGFDEEDPDTPRAPARPSPRSRRASRRCRRASPSCARRPGSMPSRSPAKPSPSLSRRSVRRPSRSRSVRVSSALSTITGS